MATKNNIRSIRFSDELAELIERQVGNTFTQKFENLITRCVYELPEKERQLEQYEQAIRDRRQQLTDLSRKATEYAVELRALERQMLIISATIREMQEL